MIYNSQVMVANRVFNATAAIGDATIKGVVQHLRSGSICIITATDGFIVNVSWDDIDLFQLALNLLSMTNSIRKCSESHLRYRRHLYLDRKKLWGDAAEHNVT